MKWIGQHIVDLIARFRSEIYLEDVSTGTIASGGHLGLDSNNKVVKTSESVSVNNLVLKYAKYIWSFSVSGGAISTITMSASTAIPDYAIIDAASSYIVTDTAVSGNSGATIEIGIAGGVVQNYLATDTDFFMAPTAYNVAPFAGYGGSIRGLTKMGRVSGGHTVTFKIAGATLTGGVVSIYIAYKTN